MPDLRSDPASLGGKEGAFAGTMGLATEERAGSGKVVVVCNDCDYFLRHRAAAMDEVAKTGARVIVYCGGGRSDAGDPLRLELRRLDC